MAVKSQKPGGSRFVISHRLAGKHRHGDFKKARETFDERFHWLLSASVDVTRDTGEETGGRRVIVFEGDPQELAAKQEALTPDTFIEHELPRHPALAKPPHIHRLRELHGALRLSGGAGTTLVLKLKRENGSMRGAKGTLYLVTKQQVNPQSTSQEAVADAEGQLTFAYDQTNWVPISVEVEPAGGAWTIIVTSPVNGQEISIPALPRSGPLGWWHLLVGSTEYSAARGEGMRIGVIDTGVGPHPYLSHVLGAGSFLGGIEDPAPASARDARNHGTHVSGIIAARPPMGSGDFGGLAPGAEVCVARVFTENGGGNQGDIALAIDALAVGRQVDLINMSLGSENPSQIERDAIITALEHGTVCICAAGNYYGQPVLAPASYPESIAVSAIGMPNIAPPGTLASMSMPAATDTDKFSPLGGLFLANFSDLGPQIRITAPGTGIISTVPTQEGQEAPYLDMSGTSMAAPIVTGALAVLLAGDAQYKALPRDTQRAYYAQATLLRSAVSLGLRPIYQGLGLVRERWPGL